MNAKPTTELKNYNNSWYKPGAGKIRQIMWFICNGIFFSSFLPGSAWRSALLRIFGARIGKNVVIKPGVNIKYPWKLKVGDYTWIGENAWIDNLDWVTIGNDCCISQGAMLLCGNHNYKLSNFDLIVKPITLENGTWLGAKSLVAPGIHCGTHSVLSAGGIATSNLEAWTIYAGNPAQKVRERIIEK